MCIIWQSLQALEQLWFNRMLHLVSNEIFNTENLRHKKRENMFYGSTRDRLLKSRITTSSDLKEITR